MGDDRDVSFLRFGVHAHPAPSESYIGFNHEFDEIHPVF